MQRLYIIFLVLFGCQSANYLYLKNPDADFSEFTTFNCPKCAVEVISNRPLYDNRTNRNLIQYGINKELTDRGYMLSEESPDLIVEYEIIIENMIDTVSQRTTDYRYWSGFETDVYNYKMGTIILNVVDSKTNIIVWQVRADKVLDREPKKVEKKLPKFIEMIFRNFPAKVDQ